MKRLSFSVNETFAIDLSQDWSNSNFTAISTLRPSASPALNYQSLWWDALNGTIYCFGGQKSADSQRASVPIPSESVWGLSPDGSGSGVWKEYLGSTTSKPFPQDIVRPSHGVSVSDGNKGYFLGGYVTLASSPGAALPWGATEFSPGILTLDFASLTLTNSTNVANFYQSDDWHPPGRMVYAPVFGTSGILVAMGGSAGQLEVGGPFNNISIFDIGSQRWFYQVATGTIPNPRWDFCAVGVHDSENNTYEM